MHFSFIIVNYNSEALLKKCIRSIFTHVKNLLYEIIVVDNASTDESPKIVETEYPSIHLIKNRENVGYASAINQGIEVSRAPYLVIMNNDIELLSNKLEMMFSIMEDNTKIGILGPAFVNADGSAQKSYFRFPSLFSRIGVLTSANKLYNRYSSTLHSASQELFEVDYVLGALMMVRKSALEAAGAFDERYFLYHEEMDLCYRFKHEGWKICSYRDAAVLHHGHHTEDPYKSQVFLERNKSLLYFYLKNYGKIRCTGLILLNLLFFYAKRIFCATFLHDSALLTSYAQAIALNRNYFKVIYSDKNK